MQHLYFLFLVVLLSGCKSKSNNTTSNKNEHSFLDSVKSECHSARILFFKDFSTSKTSIIAKEFKDQKSLDTLFAFIDDRKKDTDCYLFSFSPPLGEIYFYKDSLFTGELLDLYFVLRDKCNGFYAGIHQNSQKFDFTDLGKRSLEDLKKEVEMVGAK